MTIILVSFTTVITSCIYLFRKTGVHRSGTVTGGDLWAIPELDVVEAAGADF